jgi:hypothetical protein
MSRIKEFYHEEISNGLNQISNEDLDLDSQYEEWVKAQEEKAYLQHIEEEAEKAAFFRTYEITGNYPF